MHVQQFHRRLASRVALSLAVCAGAGLISATADASILPGANDPVELANEIAGAMSSPVEQDAVVEPNSNQSKSDGSLDVDWALSSNGSSGSSTSGTSSSSSGGISSTTSAILVGSIADHLAEPPPCRISFELRLQLPEPPGKYLLRPPRADETNTLNWLLV
jgi:hypothetical protein